MAKKKTTPKKSASAKKPAKKTTKAQAIRQFHESNPAAGPSAIAESLGKKGIKVTPGQVSTTLSSAKRKKVKKKKSTKVASPSGDMAVVNDLIATQKFTDSVGGVARARDLLSALEKLSGK